jgi:hypothetical protein
MPNPIMTITSDLHLEPRAWKNHPALSDDSYYGLEQLVDISLSYNVKALAMLGDVFNIKTPDPHTVHVCYKQIERCKQAGIQVPFLQGQHELSRNTPWLDVHPWPMHLHKLCLEVCDGLIAYGLDWTPASQIKRALEEIPQEANVLLCHQVWSNFHGGKIQTECDFADVPGHIKLLVTGDYHKHVIMRAANKAGQQMLVGSPGSICLQAINEPPSKACFVLYDDITLKSIPLRSRWFYSFRLETVEEAERFFRPDYIEALCVWQESVPVNIAKPIVHVVYDDTIPSIYSRLQHAFGDKVHLFLVPMHSRPETVQIEQKERLARASQGLVGALSLIFPADSEALHDVVRLYKATDPTDELEHMKEEFINGYQKCEAIRDTQASTTEV